MYITRRLQLIRVLDTNGCLLLREPIISMGDWRKPRRGLTKNERGIPITFFEKELEKYSIEIISKDFCFSGTPLIQRLFRPFAQKPVFSYRAYVLFDKYLSKLLRKNVKYHAINKFQKVSPQSIYYVIRKI
jgi:hypothetical protein